MFDWYPIVSRGETFFELFQEAFNWSFWHHSFLWILVFLSIFKSRYIVSVFHRKIIAYGFITFIPLLLISLSLISIFNGDKPSNFLLAGTIFTIPIFAFCIIMFIQSSRFKNSNKIILKKDNSKIGIPYSKFQDNTLTHQALILGLILLSFLFFAFCFNLLFSIPIFVFFLIMFIKSSIFKNINKIFEKQFQNQLVSLGTRFQEMPSVYQILLLNLFFILVFSVSFLFSSATWRYYFLIIILLIISIFVFFLYHKMKKLQGIKMPFKSTDYIPVAILIIIFAILAPVTIGDFVCAIPKFNCYFSCGKC